MDGDERKRRVGRRRLMMDCDICGEPMEVSRARYVALAASGQRPRCRRNGCERLCGAKRAGRSRGTEVLAAVRVGLSRVEWRRRRGGGAGRPLAKPVLSDCDEWRSEAVCDNG